ncbi:MAG: helix-turn-helix transcriptional regulator [Anaerolineae bacterium]|jgi:transcriptional regulator with XRE-family HTH domain
MAERRLALRDRMIGVLLRSARRESGRTKAECAEALGVSTDVIDAYEEGRKSISLPELEVLGYALDTPVAYFTQSEPQLKKKPDSPDFQSILQLRHRMIGVLLRQARLEAGMSRGDLAQLLNCPAGLVGDYEHGQQAIPMPELELVAQHLDLELGHFLNGRKGAVGRWHRQKELDLQFHALPTEIQEFAVKPINIKYLELAMKLSRMPASRLRDVAEALLEITY